MIRRRDSGGLHQLNLSLIISTNVKRKWFLSLAHPTHKLLLVLVVSWHCDYGSCSFWMMLDSLILKWFSLYEISKLSLEHIWYLILQGKKESSLLLSLGNWCLFELNHMQCHANKGRKGFEADKKKKKLMNFMYQAQITELPSVFG